MDNWKLEQYRRLLMESQGDEQVEIIAKMLDEEEVITEGMMDMLIDMGLATSKFIKALGKRPNKFVQAISDDTGVPVNEIMRMTAEEKEELKHKWMDSLHSGMNQAFNDAFRSMQ
jgi:hypothetical protein